ncbi:hypothetical protein Tco_0517875 [Tanacetum coccineum]
MDEEQRAQIARDEEIARQWDKEEGQRAMSEAKSSKKINWNDPSVIRYHALKMKPKTVAQARRNMVKYLKNLGNYKIRNEKIKSPKKIKEEDVDTQKEMKEVSKESGAKRKKYLHRKSTRSTVKRQKMEEDAEKEDLKGYLDIVPIEDVVEDVESLSTKGDGSSKSYKVLSEMLEDFNRQDVMDLHMLVKERYSASRPEGYDLHTLFEPDEEDEIWKNQHEYNVISWSLYDFCGIHILLMQNGIAIHMLTEKKYPLSQEMITKMLNKRLEVDHESTQAYELLKFIISQVQKIDRGVGSTSDIRSCALINFDLEVMELENTQNNALAKLPMLKLRNGNSWVPIPVTTPSETGTSTGTKMTMPSTIEEKTCKKNDVKARSLLLMARSLLFVHQLTFDTASKASFSDAIVYASLSHSTKRKGSQLVHETGSNFMCAFGINGFKVEHGTTKHEGKKVLSENWKENHH